MHLKYTKWSTFECNFSISIAQHAILSQVFKRETKKKIKVFNVR